MIKGLKKNIRAPQVNQHNAAWTARQEALTHPYHSTWPEEFSTEEFPSEVFVVVLLEGDIV